MSKIEKWFPYGIPTNTRAKAQLFCFPSAGGNAAVFKDWVNVSEKIGVIPVELPGRGRYITDLCTENIAELTDNLVQVILEVASSPMVFYGHSMGGMIAFELAVACKQNYLNGLEKLIVAGRHAPHQPDPSPLNSKMSNEEIVHQIKRMEGTPREILEHPEMLRFLLQIIRSDLKLHESFQYRGQILDIPIIAHCGSKDNEANRSIMSHWKTMTGASFDLEEFTGGHFFIQSLGSTYRKAVFDAVLDTSTESNFA